MLDSIKILMTQDGPCIAFNSILAKTKFLKEMKEHEVDMFIDEIGYVCYVKPYSDAYPIGYFLSNEGRIGLAFASEKQKFFFKEYLNIQSDSFMDMGRGYEAQLHFNDEIIKGIESYMN